jgi:uncharacterized protein (DUF362 family)
MQMGNCTRRRFLAGGSAASLGLVRRASAWAPTAPVAVARCPVYGSGVLAQLETMFDQLGGLGRIVKGKTVAIKLNLTGRADARIHHVPAGCAQWVHPDVIAATLHLMERAGVHRVRLLESPWSTAEPLEEFMSWADWDPRLFTSSAKRVEFENTNFLGPAKGYSRFRVPGGGYMFDGYDMNHAYADCDVFVSLAKLKESPAAGVTLSIKNLFGCLPATIYGDGSGETEPSKWPRGGRGIMHSGSRNPPGWKEKDPSTPREAGYRIPRIIVDVAKARPIDLAIIDGIETITRGPTPRRDTKHLKPGLLIAGTNCVTTDAVCTALMGYDPMADRGTPPFETRDNTMRLAEDAGLGTRDLRKIEVIGSSIAASVFDFRKADPQ